MLLKIVSLVISVIHLGLVVHRAKPSRKELLCGTAISFLLTAFVYVLAKLTKGGHNDSLLMNQ